MDRRRRGKQIENALAVVVWSLAMCASASAQTHVWKVGGAGGLSTVQSAVDLAADGDLILIRPGNHAGFALVDKAITLLPTPGSAVTLTDGCRVEYLAPGKTLMLGGVSCTGTLNPGTAALLLRYNHGAVVLRDAQFTGPWGYSSPVAVRLLENDFVVADTCAISGSSSTTYYGDGGSGMIARRSNLASYRTTFQGGNGGGVVNCNSWYWGYDGGDGGNGYESPEGFLFAAGGSFIGGRGGEPGPDDYDPMWGTYTPAGIGGDGGSGIVLGSIPPTTLNPRVDRLQAGASGGTAGGWGGCGYLGAPGVAVQVNNGTENVLAGTRREISVPSLAYESSVISLTATGASGERVFVMISQAPDFVYDAALKGCQLLRQPVLATAAPLGTIPPSGVLQAQLIVRRLPPGDETGTFLVQAQFIAPNGSAQISNGTAIAVVDTNVNLN